MDFVEGYALALDMTARGNAAIWEVCDDGQPK